PGPVPMPLEVGGLVRLGQLVIAHGGVFGERALTLREPLRRQPRGGMPEAEAVVRVVPLCAEGRTAAAPCMRGSAADVVSLHRRRREGGKGQSQQAGAPRSSADWINARSDDP